MRISGKTCPDPGGSRKIAESMTGKSCAIVTFTPTENEYGVIHLN